VLKFKMPDEFLGQNSQSSVNRFDQAAPKIFTKRRQRFVLFADEGKP